MRVAAVGLGLLGLAGGVLAGALLVAVAGLALHLGSPPPVDPYRALGLGLIALVCSAAGLRGAANLLAGRPDRGALQLVLAGAGACSSAGCSCSWSHWGGSVEWARSCCRWRPGRCCCSPRR